MSTPSGDDAKGIYHRYYGLSPREKQEAVILEYFQTRLAVPRSASEEIAQRFEDGVRSAAELGARTSRILELLLELVEDMETRNLPSLNVVRPQISETLLDCHHVLGDTEAISLRLNHHMRQRSRTSE